jgi:uncharacterized protein YecE (DUF72 family)
MPAVRRRLGGLQAGQPPRRERQGGLKPVARVLVGTSGFSYGDWRGPFYPHALPKARMLEFYAGVFPALEINATYYATPGRAAGESMVRRAAGRLRFAVKAPGDVTHRRSLNPDTVLPWRRFVEPFEESGTLAAVLLQFPAGFHAGPESWAFLSQAYDALRPLPLVAELRHASFDGDRMTAALVEMGYSRALVDQPGVRGLSRSGAVAGTGRIAYARFHGRNAGDWYREGGDRNARYRYRYAEEELRPWVPVLREAAAKAETALAFFNNHPDANAVQDAATLATMLGEPLAMPARENDLFG